MNILLIEDDAKLVKLLNEYLSGFQFKVTEAMHPDDGLKKLKQKREPFDVILLDLMLPDKDGFEVCRSIRSFSDIPIIMITARGDVTDKVVGLEIGADDYLAKPFEPRELVARIHAVTRRFKTDHKQQTKTKLYQFDELVIDSAAHRVFLKDKEVDLTAMEFQVLLFLAENSAQVLSRDQIVEHIHGDEFDPFNRTIDIIISRLRNKLKDDASQSKFIKTIRGVGYILNK